jgi:hypothetical protein
MTTKRQQPQDRNKHAVFSEWARAPKKGALLRVPAGVTGSAVILADDKGKRRDQLAEMMRGAPEEALTRAVESADDPGLGNVAATFVVSNERVDSYDTTFKVDGWDTRDFEKNPVVLYAHDDGAWNPRTLPIGRDVGIHKRLGGESPALVGVVRFASRELDEFADRVGRFVAARILSACSQRFEPLKWQINEKRGSGDGWFQPIDFIEQRLLEWSVVAVPANADCLVEGRQRMDDVGLGARDVADFVERAIETVGGLYIPRAELEALRSSIRGTKILVSMDDLGSFAVRADMVDDEQVGEPKSGEGEAVEATVELTCPMCEYRGAPAEFGAMDAASDGREDGADAAAEESVAALANEIADAIEEAEANG